jgi:hypothetical protein
MKKQKLNQILILTSTFILLMLNSCKTEEKILRNEKTGTINRIPSQGNYTTFNSEFDCDEQLKYLAKGYAPFLETATNRNEMTNFLLQKDYNQESHLITYGYFNLQNSMDIENEIFNNVNINSPNNNYDRSVFYGLEFENCTWSTYIRIVDTASFGLPWIVTYESTTKGDTVMGYFINSHGNLDSIELNSYNYENYLIYCVFLDSDCGLTSSLNIDQTGCNNNNVCEPGQGETVENCLDCINNPKLSNQKILQVSWVRIDKDNGMLDEAWSQGKYNLYWDWVIANDDVLVTRGARNQQDMLYNHWKRSEIEICKSKCKGTATKKQSVNNKTLYMNYLPQVEDIFILFWERDKRKDHIRNVKIQDGRDLQGNILDFDNIWNPVYRGGTFHSVNGLGYVGPGVIVIQKNTVWNTDPQNPSHHTIEVVNPSNEITIQLEYWD